jgi:hypothetical protein
MQIKALNISFSNAPSLLTPDRRYSKSVQSVKRAPVPATMFDIRSMLKLMLLNPSLTDERYRSGGQISIALQTWLQTHKANDASTLRIGKKLHRLIITTYKALWFDRCTEMRKQQLLFKDRLKYFPKQKPIHELTDEDFVSFAEAWSKKSSASITAGVAKTHRPTSMPNSIRNTHRTFKQTRTEPLKPQQLAPKRARFKRLDTPANGSSPKISKSNSHVPAGEPFHVHDQRFNDLFFQSRVFGDGNCLFRACLRALGHPDDDHAQLRQRCVQHVVSHWPQFAEHANYIHRGEQQVSEPPQSNLSVFPNAQAYADYVS